LSNHFKFLLRFFVKLSVSGFSGLSDFQDCRIFRIVGFSGLADFQDWRIFRIVGFSGLADFQD